MSLNFQLGGKITTKVDPTKPKPKDVSIIETLSEMIAKGSSLLTKYNNSGNATVDFFNVTDGFSFGKTACVTLLEGVGGCFFLSLFFVCSHCEELRAWTITPSMERDFDQAHRKRTVRIELSLFYRSSSLILNKVQCIKCKKVTLVFES